MERDELQEAQQKNRLAMRLERGEGVPIDLERARQLYQEAAEAGDPRAQNNLGYRLARGLCDFVKNGEAARGWFEQAARSPNKKIAASAMFNLAGLYRYGTPDLFANAEKEMEWMQKAADEEHPQAIEIIEKRKNQPALVIKPTDANAQQMFSLGQQYAHGQNGHEQNWEEAAKFFKQAAEKDHAGAAFELGQCYRFGRGVPENLEEAKKWLSTAKDAGVRYAAESLEKVSLLTSPDTPTTEPQKSPTTAEEIRERAYKILNESSPENKKELWFQLTTEFDDEQSIVLKGVLAFHIGSLALAKCSTIEGSIDQMTALYWFLAAKNLGFQLGAVGIALIAKSENPIPVADILLDAFEKEIHVHLDALDIYNKYFIDHIDIANAIEEENVPLFVWVCRAFLQRKDDLQKTLKDLNDLDEAQKEKVPKDPSEAQKGKEKPLTEADYIRLFATLLKIGVALEGDVDQAALDSLDTDANNVVIRINDVKHPDIYAKNLASYAKGYLVKITNRISAHEKLEAERQVIALQSHTLKGPLGNALSLLDDVRYWSSKGTSERVPVGLAALQANIGMVRNLVDANNLLLFSKEQFQQEWQADNRGQIPLAQIICEAAQQAVLRLTAKEFLLTRLKRPLSRTEVDKAAADIALIDFSEATPRNWLHNGFPLPFNYLAIQFSPNISWLIGIDSIRRRFFFTLAHELIFNAIKYESADCPIEVKLHVENERLVFSCKNGYQAKSNTSFSATSRGHDFLRRIVGKLDGAEFKVNQEPNSYTVQLLLPTNWMGDRE